MAKDDDTEDGEKKPDSEQDKEKKDRDEEETIPRSRLVAALKDQETRLTAQITALTAEVAKSKEKPVEKPREVSRAELLAAVDDGKMSLAQADQVWEKQITERAIERATAAASEVVNQRDARRRIDEDLRRYKEAVPAAWREGTDERARVAEEYRHLLSIGMPEATETELAALRAVYGPIEKIQKGRSKSERSVEAEEQSGGGGEEGGSKKSGSNYAMVKTLSARQREHYEGQIKAGRYAGWAAVEEELKYANKDVLRRNGARV